ncbi:hypothetical protein HHK36_017417 [Tetracentron sinense]|uniref:Bulb-type lectin domain-containing protein n=1 Tax=Tetracentron sinense TaxID=13715 RepID=A0A835DCL6_TETSI|nr:hypothetical protein HHK36_017417 [Tetracentron sinense]
MASALSLFLLLLPFSTIAQTSTNVSLGSSLPALNNSSFWASPSGDFAFGFQQIGTKGFLLAIWFNKIPDKTIVWSANRDNLVQGGSKVELTTDGRLVLNDPQGQEIWKATLTNNGVTHAAMLDTGNFVLANRDSVTVWESFDVPTDTILPTQILDLGSTLVSRQSEVDYSSGRFQFRLQTDGNLVLCTTAFPTDSIYYAYWESETVDKGSQVVFNQSGYIYVRGRNGNLVHITSANSVSTENFYQRAILDYDGVFRQYVYPKTISSPQSWSTVWYIPSNICMRITASYGSGACGFNSYCRLGEDQRPVCECPPGYSYLDPNNKIKGCKQNFVSQSCEEGAQESALFDMREMPDTDWPLSDFEWYQSVSEDWCREACLSDCFCYVGIFRNGNCWKKKLPLSNGRIDPSVGGKALIKIRKDNSSSESPGH